MNPKDDSLSPLHLSHYLARYVFALRATQALLFLCCVALRAKMYLATCYLLLAKSSDVNEKGYVCKSMAQSLTQLRDLRNFQLYHHSFSLLITTDIEPIDNKRQPYCSQRALAIGRPGYQCQQHQDFGTTYPVCLLSSLSIRRWTPACTAIY